MLPRIFQVLKFLVAVVTGLVFLSASTPAFSYPLDGYDETKIQRLDGYFHSLLTDDGLANLTAGALQSYSELKLNGASASAFPAHVDRALQQELQRIAGSSISISLLDLTNPRAVRYAGVRDTAEFVPGSVGKVMIAVSLFDALARLYPNSIEDRIRILRDRIITANELIETDPHVVPFWNSKERKIYFRPLQIGDQGNVWTYLDWMLSASSNAAAAMVIREVLLMNHFGKSYPPSDSQADAFIKSGAAQSLLSRSLIAPLNRLSLSGGALFQTSSFTRRAKSILPGIGSSATTRSLAHLMFLLDQGRVVDQFSSLEIKRLLYMTQRRERYAGNISLDDAAVYFKAGSLYSCRPERGYACDKYLGNLVNQMNAVAIIEDPVAQSKLRYIVAVSSNVLRYNSDQLHNEIAGKVHSLVTRINTK